MATVKRSKKKQTMAASTSASQSPQQETTHREHSDVLDMLLKREQGERNYFPEEQVHYEGQLAIDMIETPTELVILSTVAGADPESLHINVNGDVLTIRGKREAPVTAKTHEHLYKECFWGWFSRTIILPVDINSDEVKAEFHNGVLIVHVPKVHKVREVPIHVIEE